MTGIDLLKFIASSSFEYLSSLIFILIQFKFSIRENIPKILLISILLSFVSYSFINADLRSVSPLVQNGIFLIYIWMILKVSLPNSIIMLLTGYTVFGLVQTCVMAIFAHLELFRGELIAGAGVTYQISIISCAGMLLLSASTYLLKGGFSFIDNRGRMKKKKATTKYKVYVVYISLSFLITLAINLYLLNAEHPNYLLAVCVLMVILLFLIYFSLKRDDIVD